MHASGGCGASHPVVPPGSVHPVQLAVDAGVGGPLPHKHGSSHRSSEVRNVSPARQAAEERGAGRATGLHALQYQGPSDQGVAAAEEFKPRGQKPHLLLRGKAA